MENLNAEQIIRALENWIKNYVGNALDLTILCNALALITSQEQRIKELSEENERLRAENAKYEAENHAEFNKWLKLEEATKRHHSELFEEAKVVVKEETVREMRELIYERLDISVEGYSSEEIKSDVRDMVDRIATEMLEDGEERTCRR